MILYFESSRWTERWWRLLEGFECCWTSYLRLMNRTIESLDDRNFNDDESCQGKNHVSFHRCRRYSPFDQDRKRKLVLADAVCLRLSRWRLLSELSEIVGNTAEDVGGTSKLTSGNFWDAYYYLYINLEVLSLKKGSAWKALLWLDSCSKITLLKILDGCLDLGSGIWDRGSGIRDQGSGIWDHGSGI